MPGRFIMPTIAEDQFSSGGGIIPETTKKVGCCHHQRGGPMPEYEARGKKFKIPMTPKERKYQSLERAKAKGKRQLTVSLDADTWIMINDLLDTFPRLKKMELIARLIHDAHEKYCGGPAG